MVCRGSNFGWHILFGLGSSLSSSGSKAFIRGKLGDWVLSGYSLGWLNNGDGDWISLTSLLDWSLEKWGEHSLSSWVLLPMLFWCMWFRRWHLDLNCFIEHAIIYKFWIGFASRFRKVQFLQMSAIISETTWSLLLGFWPSIGYRIAHTITSILNKLHSPSFVSKVRHDGFESKSQQSLCR